MLRFLASPVEIVGEERVEGVRLVRNEIAADGAGRLTARPTGETELLECGLVLRSIGYRGSPIPGVPFDERRATIHNDGGRVTRAGSGEPVPGVYAAGWIKRGPSGVIGTNKKCAQETVDLLLEDLAAGRLPEPSSDPAALVAALEERGVEVVDYAGWEAIDAHERGLGEPHGRPRVKLVRRAEHLLHAASSKVRGAGRCRRQAPPGRAVRPRPAPLPSGAACGHDHGARRARRADARHDRDHLDRRGRLLRGGLRRLVGGEALDPLAGALERLLDGLELEVGADGLDRAALLAAARRSFMREPYPAGPRHDARVPR